MIHLAGTLLGTARCPEFHAVVGIPSTIDNDLVGTDVSIGTDTALNKAGQFAGRR